jgi:hypothetical protein
MDTPADSIKSLLEDTTITRRQFGQGLATAAGIATINPPLTAIEDLLKPITTPLEEVRTFASEVKETFSEIASIREEIGYTRRFSPALNYLRENVVEHYFDEKPPEQEVNIELEPQYLYSNLQSISDILETTEILLGFNTKKILRYIRQGSPDNYFSFNITEGQLNLPPDSKTLHNLERVGLVDVILHEVGGHGVDPDGLNAQESLTPLQILKMSAAKWRALSYADKVPGLFKQHEQDASSDPLTKFNVKLGDNFKTASFESNIIGEGLVQGTPEAMGKISDLYTRYINVLIQDTTTTSSSVTDPRNYEMVCLLMGSELTNGIKSGNIKLLDQELTREYNDALEWRDKEIFAEMVKYSILYPSLLEDTPEGQAIKNNIEDFYRILRKDPNLKLEDLQAQLMTIS